MTEIKLTKRYPHSRTEDITDAFMRGYEQGKKDGLKVGKQIVLGAFETYITADRKTENSSEKPNNCEELNAYRECVKSRSFWDSKHCDGCYFDERCPFDEPKDEPTISKMEQVDEPQTVSLTSAHISGDIYHKVKDEPRLTAKCLNCANGGSYKCSKCDGEMYYKYDKDEPQTDEEYINNLPWTEVGNGEQTDNLFTDKDGDVWEWRGDAWYCISGDEPQTERNE